MTASYPVDPPTRDWAVFAYICGDNPHIAPHARAQVDGLLKFAGSEHLHVAAQWDLPDIAERAVYWENGKWEREPLDRVNTGDPDVFLSFLNWAFDRCPAEHVIIVISGTGLLDPRAYKGGPDTDRAHLFTVCDDHTADDALSLSELRQVLIGAVDASSHEQLAIVALDMRELQCLEVAYELEGLAEVLIGPQTRVPDSGWNFELVLRDVSEKLKAASADGPMPVHDMARLLVRTVGTTYAATKHGELSLSALDLSALKGVASAFDTLSLAMVHSVGEELVWNARAAVAKRLKPDIVLPSSEETQESGIPGDDTRDIQVETEYLYDLVEMLTAMQREFVETEKSGLTSLVLDHFQHLDYAGFLRAIESVDVAAFARARQRATSLQDSITDAQSARRRLRKLIKTVRMKAEGWTKNSPGLQDDLSALLKDPLLHSPKRYSWLEGWPDEVIDDLEPQLASLYRAARRQQQRLVNLAALTDRVLRLLTGATDATTGKRVGNPLVIEHFMSGAIGNPRHGGVSLFRPRELDQLIASDYLKLRFNQKIHWTVLLAVINLIGSHPRALWRILSAVLATADNSTRAELIERITGPGSVVAQFKDQFVVLAPAKTFVLSLEPDAAATRATGQYRRPTSDDSPAPQSYRVRLELADREALISDVTSRVDPESMQDVINGLVELMKPATPMTSDDARTLESLGKTLGEDILQSLGKVLGDRAERAQKRRERIHLQLQLPRDLMAYPWELMHHKGGWLAEDFALGRQVFSRSIGRGTTSRAPGPLRALVIGNPQSTVELPYAAHEAERIASQFAALASETDGLIDFVLERDARINQRVTRRDLRDLLRERNYDILHFAGHASFDPQYPENSAWLLSDGRLSAQQIRNTLEWRDAQPWLVYANACEAGMDGKTTTMYQSDVFGIASAFIDSGVSVFIGPLWRIDDAIAAQVAHTFYEQLLGERQTVGEALRIAKVEAKDRHFDPATAPDGPVLSARIAKTSWAGLILYGNSTATIGQRVGASSLNQPPAQSDKTEGDDGIDDD